MEEFEELIKTQAAVEEPVEAAEQAELPLEEEAL
jgi:hypothetical protein